MGTKSAQHESESGGASPAPLLLDDLRCALNEAVRDRQWSTVERLAAQIERLELRLAEESAGNVTRLPARKKDGS